MDRWPLYSVVIFVQALPLLFLWIMLAVVLDYFLGVLGAVRSDEPNIILLLTALAGFGIQQWKSMEEEFRQHRQAVEEALKEVERLDRYLRQRKYVQALDHYSKLYAETGREWQSVLVQEHLRVVWNQAPEELRLFFKVWKAFNAQESSQLADVSLSSSEQRRKYKEATAWAYEHLDETWRQEIVKMLDFADVETKQEPTSAGAQGQQEGGKGRPSPDRNFWYHVFPGELVQQIRDREWQGAFRFWPEITFYQPLPLPASSLIERASTYLDLTNNTFSASRAEEDRYLLKLFLPPKWFQELKQQCWDSPRSTVIVGPRGSGKTATAFYLVKQAFSKRQCFPVYVSFQMTSPSEGRVREAIGTVVGRLPFVTSRPVVHQQGVAEVARAMAYALCFYLGLKPSGFLDLDTQAQAAIAFLLELYVGSETAVYYHLAGWSKSGYTGKVLRAVRRLTSNMPRSPSDIDDRMLTQLVRSACPCGFDGVLVLADVRAEGVGAARTGHWEKMVRELLRVFDYYTRAGVVVHLFLPDEHTRHILRGHSIKPFTIRWPQEELQDLLERRLTEADKASGGGEQILRSWCQPDTSKEVPNISTWVTHRINTPRELIEKVQQLMEQVGRKQQRLSLTDLTQILGSYPER